MIKEKTKKILVFLIIISFIFFNFSLTLANSEDAPPENNPLCWKKEACERKRIEIFGERMAGQTEGWIKEGVCTGEWGKCLSVIEVNLKVPIGENRVISNIANYLVVIYDYSLKVIAILAVVVLIISGMQWITSAGRGEVIKKAQKRIIGVIIGLGLAYFSFVILNSINPSLTALNAPNIWMVAPAEIRSPMLEEGEYCDPAGNSDTKFACEQGGRVCAKINPYQGDEGPCAFIARLVAEVSVGALAAGSSAFSSLATEAVAPALKVAINSVGNSARTFVSNIPSSAIARIAPEGLKAVITGIGKNVFSVKGVKTAAGAAVAGGIGLAGGGAIFCNYIDSSAYDLIPSCRELASAAAGAAVQKITRSELKNFLENHNGVCIDKPEDIPDGQMCSMDSGYNQCETGSKCVKLGGVTDFLNCFSKGSLGFCSNGGNNALCDKNTDCKTDEGFTCVDFANIKSCSDRQLGSPCGSNTDCISGHCNRSRCVTGVLAKENELCGITADCESSLQCIGIKCGDNNYVQRLASPGICNSCIILNGNNTLKSFGVCRPTRNIGSVGTVKNAIDRLNLKVGEKNIVSGDYQKCNAWYGD